jgi:predicted deacylase
MHRSSWSARVARLACAVFTGCLGVAVVPALAQAQQPFAIAGVTAQPGQLVSGSIDIAPLGGDRGATIPFSILHGATPGPVLALIAGVHGYEYPPILALQRLRTSIAPSRLAGTIILVHVANMPGFLGRAIYYTPGDGKNLNRVFPGRADGTISERIAHAITHEIIDRSDYVIDIHCGDGNESLRPYLYWVTTGAPAVVEAGRKLALAFGMDHIVIDAGRPADPAASVYLANTAITRGKPGLTVESGGMGQSDEESIARIERGVRGVLRHLKLSPDGPPPIEHVVWLDPSQVLTAGATGLWYPAVEKSATVAKGALVGRITDFFGRLLEEIRAPFDGEMLYVVGTPPISKGEPVGFVAARAQRPQK